MASSSGPRTRDDAMRLIPGNTLVAVIVSSLVLSCTDGNSPADLDSGDGATVALAILPTFAAGLLQGDGIGHAVHVE